MLISETICACSENCQNDIKAMCGQKVEFLGAIAKLRNATVKIFTPVCPSVRQPAWNNSAPTGRIFMKFYISVFLENLLRKFKFSLQSDRNNGWFTWRPVYIFDHISLNNFLEIEIFQRVVVERINAHILCLTLRRLMSYIYGAPILDVSRSHTTTQHSR